ncbi:MAG TPA: GspE/PulE family protein [Arenimonas sp.]|uniref:GspE/PulE family protein n=1 Tax=Arenimonas sp. TaxID=1872635 RepID=UPI002D805D9C|nr:GspE/PulE family protein [Arenimonas sp.]HEU0152697.1 GspE/PulE family protein [Arenimonas sp.]
MEPNNHAPRAPHLIADAATLAAYVKDVAAGGHSWQAPNGQLGLAAWLALGDDCTEAAYQLASRLGLPLVRLADLPPAADATALLRPEVVRRLRAVPLRLFEGMVAIAMEDPGSPDSLATLDFLCRQRVLPLVATAREIREGIAEHYDKVEDRDVAHQLGLDPGAAGHETSIQEAERLSREKPVVRIVQGLIGEAVARRASDIHLRPGEHGTEVLYRIDDEMVPVRRLLRSLHPAVTSRVKVLGAMNLAEHRKPQDGRTTFTLDDGREVDLRISVLPAVYGESVVIRLLDTNESLWDLEQLGLSAADRQRIEDVMGRSHGMFLTTGPTGCGKSTTLYAMLLELRKQRINILTIEDPVEFYIDEIQQMQVNRAAGFTFASAMRNFLRHDPDVIMVGEIRDEETAGIAVESALTGHLLLSTLHTNTAATTVTRLLDLGVEAYLLRASLLAVMSQRLVRLTCAHCREVEKVDWHIRGVLGVGEDEVFHVGRGCSHCDGLGVFKRRAVYEFMVVTPRIQSLIVPGAEADTIHRTAIEEGMVPITQAAVQLARDGLISLSEAWRVRAD